MKKGKYDKQYIEKLYFNYLNEDFNDSESIKSFGKEILKYKKIILVAPGSSIKDYFIPKELIDNACIISINFYYKNIEPTFCFFSNSKRLADSYDLSNNKILITSNLREDIENYSYCFSRRNLSYHNDIFCDDSTLMVLNLLKRFDIKEIYIAGFDGFRKDRENFFSDKYVRNIKDEDFNTDLRKKVLREISKDINIVFLTESLYKS